MSQKQPHEHGPSEGQSDLWSKPQRGSRWRLPMFLLLLGLVIVMGGGSVLAWQVVSHQSTPVSGISGPGNSQSASTAGAKQGQLSTDCSHGFPPSYNETLKQQFAQGVHLSVAQVTNELKAGKPVTDLATEQGISSNQLFTLELHAYQVADDLMVTIGCMNQYSANLDVQRYRDGGATQLNYDFTFLFTH